MDYKQIYNDLCARSQTRKWEKFTYEKHHIVPKSLGGTDAKSNIAILTPREHALAHLLLVKFLTGEHKAKMIFALKTMVSYRNHNRTQLTTRQYETIRQTFQTLSQSPEYRAMRSKITKAQWTPERRAAVAEKTRQQWTSGPKRESFSSPEYRAKKAQQTKIRWQDPAWAKKQSEWALAQWKDPSKRPAR